MHPTEVSLVYNNFPYKEKAEKELKLRDFEGGKIEFERKSLGGVLVGPKFILPFWEKMDYLSLTDQALLGHVILFQYGIN